MGKAKGFTMVECDRCGEKEYLTDDAPNWSSWHDVERVDMNGVRVGRVLCDQCHREYRKLTSGQDAEFNAFMENK